MADSNNFKFYSNFLYAIDKLPEDKRDCLAEAIKKILEGFHWKGFWNV